MRCVASRVELIRRDITWSGYEGYEVLITGNGKDEQSLRLVLQ